MKNIPQPLKKGDAVIIVSPARKISLEEVQPFICLLEKWGLNVIWGDYLFNSFNQFSGSDQERLADFQNALDHPSVKAILCARGGYGSVRIIDQLNFSKFIQSPKWLIGYSDITVFHQHIHQNFNIATLHATMPIDYKKATPESFESLRKALFGENYNITVNNLPIHNIKKQSKPILIKGKIVGGNLSIIYSLLGSSSAADSSGKIFFIEDLDEYLYHIDRMMISLKRSGLLENIKALIVGSMSNMHDNSIPFGKNTKEIILDVCRSYDFPVIFDFPVGHADDNRALVLNKECQLIIESDLVSLQF
ncbi:MAG: LD-carboxypeptidase [Flavobacteriales bacterium]